MTFGVRALGGWPAPAGGLDRRGSTGGSGGGGREGREMAFHVHLSGGRRALRSVAKSETRGCVGIRRQHYRLPHRRRSLSSSSQLQLQVDAGASRTRVVIVGGGWAGLGADGRRPGGHCGRRPGRRTTYRGDRRARLLESVPQHLPPGRAGAGHPRRLHRLRAQRAVLPARTGGGVARIRRSGAAARTARHLGVHAFPPAAAARPAVSPAAAAVVDRIRSLGRRLAKVRRDDRARAVLGARLHRAPHSRCARADAAGGPVCARRALLRQRHPGHAGLLHSGASGQFRCQVGARHHREAHFRAVAATPHRRRTRSGAAHRHAAGGCDARRRRLRRTTSAPAGHRHQLRVVDGGGCGDIRGGHQRRARHRALVAHAGARLAPIPPLYAPGRSGCAGGAAVLRPPLSHTAQEQRAVRVRCGHRRHLLRPERAAR
eukprot:ctg_1419.g298